jgi:hypothetical protein
VIQEGYSKAEYSSFFKTNKLKPMERHDLKELSKFCDSDSILVVGKKGIYRLQCPFQVECIKDVADYLAGMVFLVDAVKMNAQCRLIYQIEGKQYYHFLFAIMDKPTYTKTTFN